MYRPPAFREDRVEILHDAIRAHPLATLVTCGASGLIANVVPFGLRTRGETGVLRAHLAKANGQVADLRAGAPTLVLFHGPQAYVSPSWYPAKREHGRVVPTWNYVIVQVRGAPRIVEDADWLRDQIADLTATHERGRAEPWRVADAPADFIAAQMKGIVGLEVAIDRIEGKWKVSQNQPAPNRHGVEQGLRADGHDDLAGLVAGWPDDA